MEQEPLRASGRGSRNVRRGNWVQGAGLHGPPRSADNSPPIIARNARRAVVPTCVGRPEGGWSYPRTRRRLPRATD
jgi:hypothetical protein